MFCSMDSILVSFSEGNFSSFLNDRFLEKILRKNSLPKLRIFDVRGRPSSQFVPLTIQSANMLVSLHSCTYWLLQKSYHLFVHVFKTGEKSTLHPSSTDVQLEHHRRSVWAAAILGQEQRVELTYYQEGPNSLKLVDQRCLNLARAFSLLKVQVWNNNAALRTAINL